MPCVPAAGIQAGCFIVPPDRLAGVGRVRAGRSGLSHLDRRLLGPGRRTFRSSPPRRPRFRPGQNIVLQTTGQNMVMVSDAPPTPVTGGIVLKSVSGAMIVVNETGIYISNGQGAMITLIGPAVDINLGALDGDLAMPGPILAYGSDRDLRARRTGDADRAQPARAGLRHADRHHRRALRGRRMRLRAARRQRPVRHRAMGRRRRARDCRRASRS